MIVFEGSFVSLCECFGCQDFKIPIGGLLELSKRQTPYSIGKKKCLKFQTQLIRHPTKKCGRTKVSFLAFHQKALVHLKYFIRILSWVSKSHSLILSIMILNYDWIHEINIYINNLLQFCPQIMIIVITIQLRSQLQIKIYFKYSIKTHKKINN